MPFKSTQTLPQRNPDVQMFFHGLLMLCPNADGSMCEIGVHRLSVEHRLSISVREKSSEAPDPPLLRLSGTLDSTGLTIEVIPTSDGVSQFVPTSDLFDRFSENNDPKDFRWAIDLDQLDPASGPIKLIQSAIQPSIKVMDGLFHTARLTNPETIEVELTEVGHQPINLNSVAQLVGANIYLEEGQRVKLTWFGEGRTRTLELPRSNGTKTFVIYIDNSQSLMLADRNATEPEPTHSEFVEYYKAVQSPTRTFDLDFDEVGDDVSNTDAAPCMVVVVGGGGKG
ncbi:MAG TPA: hypothetical protein VMS31_00030 [Pyrinomonadaceae bacterium]|nr:hypothetical protein [Pyrinomonadaceae bacterium]